MELQRKIWLGNDGSEMSFWEVRGNLELRLVNRRRNKKQLAAMPHIPVLDMAVVIYADLDQENGRTEGFYVMDTHLKTWNVDKEQVFQKAVDNMAFGRERICSMVEKLLDSGVLKQKPMEEEEIEMHILSNDTMEFGAIEMLRPGVLKRFADRLGTDLAILPSSVHEVLLIPLRGDESIRELSCMVRAVNHEVVSNPDILGEQAYLYHRETDEIELTESEAEGKHGYSNEGSRQWKCSFLPERVCQEAIV